MVCMRDMGTRLYVATFLTLRKFCPFWKMFVYVYTHCVIGVLIFV